MNKKLSLFEDKEIRKVYKNNQWYYCINDVIAKLTKTNNPNQYIRNIKEKDTVLKKEWNHITININMNTKDNVIRKVRATNTFGILRILESINTEEVEPIKKWLAKLGNERIEEINNPEKLMDKMKLLYEAKGYSSNWIEKREREITTRQSLKDEWKNRGIQEDEDYLLLINEISKSNYNLNTKELSNIELSKNNMTNMELALTNLNESIIIELHHKNNSQGVNLLKKDIIEAKNLIKDIKKEIENKLEKNNN